MFTHFVFCFAYLIKLYYLANKEFSHFTSPSSYRDPYWFCFNLNLLFIYCISFSFNHLFMHYFLFIIYFQILVILYNKPFRGSMVVEVDNCLDLLILKLFFEFVLCPNYIPLRFGDGRESLFLFD